MILDYQQIGKNLARRRKELRLKQYEVCERAKVNDKYLSCIETARSIPSLEVFLKLCTALETTPDHILLGTVRQTDYSKDDAILLEKFQNLSPDNKRLCFALHSWTCSLIAFRSIRKIPNGLDSAFPFRPCFYYTQEARQTLVRSKTVYRYSPKKIRCEMIPQRIFSFFPLMLMTNFPFFLAKVQETMV